MKKCWALLFLLLLTIAVGSSYKHHGGGGHHIIHGNPRYKVKPHQCPNGQHFKDGTCRKIV